MDTPTAPTRNLVRFTPLVLHDEAEDVEALDLETLVLRAESDGEHDGPGTIFGYPIVFNTWTEINSWWEGNFMERIAPGAMDWWLGKRAGRMRNLYEHGFDPQIGSKPLGKPSVEEGRKRGFYYETPLSNTDYNRDQIAPLIRDGAIDGQSFRFSVLDERWKSYADGDDHPDYNPKGLDERTITRMEVPEYGPVTFPAYEAASVGIRTAAEYVAWQQADDDLRAAMIMAKLDDVDPERVRSVVQRLRNGDPLVQLGTETEVTAEVEEPPADGDEREEMGTPGHRSQMTARRDEAALIRARAQLRMQEATSYARRAHD